MEVRRDCSGTWVLGAQGHLYFRVCGETGVSGDLPSGTKIVEDSYEVPELFTARFSYGTHQ